MKAIMKNVIIRPLALLIALAAAAALLFGCSDPKNDKIYTYGEEGTDHGTLTLHDNGRFELETVLDVTAEASGMYYFSHFIEKYGVSVKSVGHYDGKYSCPDGSNPDVISVYLYSSAVKTLFEGENADKCNDFTHRLFGGVIPDMTDAIMGLSEEKFAKQMEEYAKMCEEEGFDGNELLECALNDLYPSGIRDSLNEKGAVEKYDGSYSYECYLDNINMTFVEEGTAAE